MNGLTSIKDGEPKVLTYDEPNLVMTKSKIGLTEDKQMLDMRPCDLLGESSPVDKDGSR